MEQIQTDLISREKIIHNINHNYFVEAGAGSGKTTVLVKRIVSMIEQGIDISRICAITFTQDCSPHWLKGQKPKQSRILSMIPWNWTTQVTSAVKDVLKLSEISIWPSWAPLTHSATW